MTTDGGVLLPEDAQVVPEVPAAQAEAESREPSDYVVLVGIDHEDGALWWKELDGTVSGKTKRGAYNAAVAKFGLEPTDVGEEAKVHLVPVRSWKRITLRRTQPQPTLEIDGL